MPRSQRWKSRRKSETASSANDAGGGHSSLRDAYETCGTADSFYKAYGSEYNNPHEQLLRTTMIYALGTWDAAGLLGTSDAGRESKWRALDCACGGGEATLILTDWWESGRRSTEDLQVVACDPYTAARYKQKIGHPAHSWSFADIAGGALDELPIFDVVLCSFCLHLLRDDEALHATLCALSRSSRLLLVATPHKRPTIDKSTGWETAADEVRASDVTEEGATRHRCTVRLYRSTRVRDG